jgi:hypothetical protein
MAVSVDASTSYSINKKFHQAYQYAMFNFNNTRSSRSKIPWTISTDSLKQRLAANEPFDSTDWKLVASFKMLFKPLGTHVIVGGS